MMRDARAASRRARISGRCPRPRGEGARAVGVALREVAQPPGDGLLDEPPGVGDISRHPAENTLAAGEVVGSGCLEAGPGQGHHKGGAARPEERRTPSSLRRCSSRDGSARSRLCPAMAAWSAMAQASKSGTQGDNHAPDGAIIGPEPASRSEASRRRTRGLVNIASPETFGQRETVMEDEPAFPGLHEVVDTGVGDAEADPLAFVVGVISMALRAPALARRAARAASGRHSTVTDFARLRAWSTSVPIATAV